MTPPSPKPKDYDERIYRKGHPPHRVRNALILIGLVIVGTYLAWTKSIPFTPEYEVKAVFENSANIRKDSPVRIAGVNVGEVVSTRSVGNASEVTFTVNDSGRPLHEDAQVEIRPRIFLEGNFFVDVEPGTPSAPELSEGDVIPVNQTATPVLLDQVLTALQSDTREDLQVLLKEYASGLEGKGARGFNRSIEHWEPAYRDSAIVAEASLGEAEHDLSGYVREAGAVAVYADPQALLDDFENSPLGRLAPAG